MNPSEAVYYIQCPRKFFNYKSRGFTPTEPDKRQVIIKRCIQYLYSFREETGVDASIKHINKAVDRELWSAETDKTLDTYDKIKGQSISILSILHKYYSEYYLTKKDKSITNICATFPISKIPVDIEFDIVFMKDKSVELVQFFDKPSSFNYKSITNDFATLTKFYALDKLNGGKALKVNAHVIGEKSVHVEELSIPPDLKKTVAKSVEAVYTNISEAVVYPNIGAHCNSCDFYEKCITVKQGEHKSDNF